MKEAAEVKKDISENISRVSSDGADYVDVRYYLEDSSETLLLYDGNLEANDTTLQSGIGVRVLWNGAWGFAATSDPSGLKACFDKATLNARTASELVKEPLSMGKREPVRGNYATPVEVDPFAVSLKDKMSFLTDLDKELKDEFILRRMVYANFMKKKINFQNSEGSEIDKDLLHVFGMMMVMALDSDGEMQRRSMNLYSTGDGTAGWKMMTTPELFAGHASRVKSELAELVEAEPLEYGRRSVILLPGQGHLQVHETIGHP
ncbi:MAG: hypothetical protein GF388_11325, partial [Candidatus Aegiribacteria sp.]|nr:hypothetical protein [Candidatus Aegiribacteria sp.]MBD3295584.1 hypothetical protein [Candidatus Fermentibacteria bacterium]